jgi:hypothetical protein
VVEVDADNIERPAPKRKLSDRQKLALDAVRGASARVHHVHSSRRNDPRPMPAEFSGTSDFSRPLPGPDCTGG